MVIVKEARLKKSTMLACGVYEDYFNVTLDNYRGNKNNLKHVEKYINNLDTVRKNGLSLLMIGDNNCGKTSLAMIIAKACLINGLSVKVTSLQEMTDMFTQTWQDNRSKADFNNVMRDRDLLVIDDLNKEFHNRATAAVLDFVIRHRSNRHLPFIITTNASTDELTGLYGKSFIALLHRRAAVLEFKPGMKDAEKLIDKNIAILHSLGEVHA